jgi:hypothetical protein
MTEKPMSVLTWVAVVVVAGGGAFFAGRLTAPKPAPADNSAEVAQAFAANTDALHKLTEASSKPITLDAETRQALASDVPSGCLDPAASLTAPCLAAACWRYQQGDGGRSDASKCSALVDDARVQGWIALCGKDEGGKPDWACVAAAAKAKSALD